MSAGTPERESGGLFSQRERKRLVDGLTLATIAAIFVSSAVPWFLQALEIELQTVAWTAFLLAAAYVSIAVIVDRVGSRPVVTAALYLGPAVATVMAAVLWHLSGGIAHPALLISFVIPVLAAAILPNRWGSFAIAAFAAIVVAVTSMIESPAFAWYLNQMGLPTRALESLLPVMTRDVSLMEVSPAALFTSLQAFTVSMLVVAGFCRAIVRFVTREAVHDVRVASPGETSLSGSAIHAAPASIVIVAAETARIIDGSATFFQRMIGRRGEIVGRELFDIVRFDERDALELLLARGGRLEFAIYHVGREERLADVRAERFRHDDSDYCIVTMHEWEGVGFLVAAEDARERPLIIAGSDGRLRYGNHAAAQALGDVYVGRDIGALVQAASAGSVAIGPHLYDAALSQLRRSSAGAESFTVITLEPRPPA